MTKPNVTEEEAPKIEFPCDYPIKVMGRNVDSFEMVVYETVEKHAPGFDRKRVQVKESRKGSFASLTIFMTATGKPQLEALHQDLMDTGLVQMVL